MPAWLTDAIRAYTYLVVGSRLSVANRAGKNATSGFALRCTEAQLGCSGLASFAEWATRSRLASLRSARSRERRRSQIKAASSITTAITSRLPQED
jgi:hypothetical protein